MFPSLQSVWQSRSWKMSWDKADGEDNRNPHYQGQGEIFLAKGEKVLDEIRIWRKSWKI